MVIIVIVTIIAITALVIVDAQIKLKVTPLWVSLEILHLSLAIIIAFTPKINLTNIQLRVTFRSSSFSFYLNSYFC